MIKKYKGIVISAIDYKEGSKIINLFTEKDGIIGIIARGAKKINSKLSTGTNTLSYGYYYVNEKEISSTIRILSEIEIIDNFKNIRKDIIKSNYAIYLLELSTKVYKHEKNKEIYNHLIKSLHKINEGYNPRFICTILELKMLDYLGIKPVIDKCVNCGNTDNIVTISSYKGGYLCNNCKNGEKIFNLKTIQLIRMFYYVDIEKIKKLEISDNIINEIDIFVDDYYDRYSGLYLKSKDLLKKIAKIDY